MNIEQNPHRMHHEEGVVITGTRAKQGDRRTFTFWILVVSTIAAVAVGMVLLLTTEDYTAKPPEPTKNAPTGTQSPPAVPKPS